MRIILHILLAVTAHAALSLAQSVWLDADGNNKLFDHIFRDYSHLVVPREKDEPANVSVGFSPIWLEMKGTREPVSHVLSCRTMLYLTWNDYRLRWDVTKFNNVRVLNLPSDMIWTPDIAFYNGIGDTMMKERGNVVIYADGTVHWVPLYQVEIPCLAPRDTMYNCTFSFGSWTHDTNSIRLVPQENGFGTSTMIDQKRFPREVWIQSKNLTQKYILYESGLQYQEIWANLQFTYGQ